MHIESIPMWEGSGNNYAYLVTDEKTKDAVIIDPANPSEWAKKYFDAALHRLTSFQEFCRPSRRLLMAVRSLPISSTPISESLSMTVLGTQEIWHDTATTTMPAVT